MAPPRTRTVPVGFGEPPSKRAKRMRTTGSTLEIPQDVAMELSANVNTLRRHVYQEVIYRLQKAQAVVSGLSLASVDWMLPTGHVDLWENFLEFPMLTNDLELQTMMDLEQSTIASPAPPKGSTVYYVRSFEFSASELEALIANLELNDVRVANDKIKAWTATIALFPTQKLFIRYVGMTQTVSAFSRFTADYFTRDGLYGAFVASLRAVVPSVYRNCKVYSFPQAAIDAFEAPDGSSISLHHSETDSREQALIELFGRSTLLNRRTGGLFNSYQPSDADIALFSRLNTQAFSKLEVMIRDGEVFPPDDYTKQHVAEYAYEVHELGEAYPEELGIDGVPASKDMQRAWAGQASYASCHGSTTLFLLVGDYLPLSAMHNPAPYWEQTKARSVRYMKDTLSRLRAVEQNRSTWDDANIDGLISASLLPFVDLQYTPKHNARVVESAAILREYMASAKPLIVMTFERRTAAIVGTNFVGTYNGKHLTPVAGLPRIRYFTDPGKVTGRGTSHIAAEFAPDPDDCFIQIPSFHPGSLGYDEVNAARQVVDMTQWHLCLAIDVVLDLLAEGLSEHRAQLCKRAMEEMERRWNESGCADAMVVAKRALQTKHYDTKKGRYSSEPTRMWRGRFDGTEIPVNQEGFISLYWEMVDGTREKVNLRGGREGDIHPPKNAKGADKTRTIHFTPLGIDIQKADGTSCTFTKSSHAYTNPTFPGAVIRDKVGAGQMGTEFLIDLWESETDLVFASTFPQGQLKTIGFNNPSQTAKHHKPPSRKGATISKSTTAASAQRSAATKASSSKTKSHGNAPMTRAKSAAKSRVETEDKDDFDPFVVEHNSDEEAPETAMQKRKAKSAVKSEVDAEDDDDELDDFIVPDDEELEHFSNESDLEDDVPLKAKSAVKSKVEAGDDEEDDSDDVVRPPTRKSRLKKK